MMFTALALLGPTYLDAMDLSQWRQGFGNPEPNHAVGRGPLRVAGREFARGVGSHAPGGARYDVAGEAASIEGAVGVNETGTGSVIFSIWGDGRRLWRSPRLTRTMPPVEFRADLSGVRTLTLVASDAFDGNGGDHANWLDVRINHRGRVPRPLPYMRNLTLLPDRHRQTIDNFAASDSWTVEPLFRWPEAQRKKIAKLLFDPKQGAGLSGWRHNLGGGLNHETISIPLRTVQTYETAEGQYDFERNPGKRWMLKAAKDAGVSDIVLYAVTPPRRLTRNGFTNGTDGQGSTNLKPGAEPAFARYLADVVAHYRSQGYPVTHLSPVNEPDFEWNAGTQEGNRASNADIVAITRAIRTELLARKLPVRLLTPEANSPQVGYEANEGMARKYGSPYGAYTDFFAKEADWRREVDPVYAYHSYWADRLDQIVTNRRRLREGLDRSPGLKAWQTEYCQMAGPRGEGGWGRDLGMTLALNVARLIHFDMTVVEASAWQWWLAVSDSDYKDGLVYVDDLDKPGGTIYPSKTLWTLGQWSRFVRPGFQRIDTEGAFEDVAGVLPSAYRDPKTGRIVVVLVNTETSSEPIDIRLPGRWKTSAWITSDRPGHDLARFAGARLGESMSVPSRSVVTLVLDPLP